MFNWLKKSMSFIYNKYMKLYSFWYIHRGEIWLQFSSLFILYFSLFSYIFYQRTVTVSHFFFTLFKFLSLLLHNHLSKFSNTLVFFFPSLQEILNFVLLIPIVQEVCANILKLWGALTNANVLEWCHKVYLVILLAHDIRDII